MLDHLPAWVLAEPVDVTCVSMTMDGYALYLVEKTSYAWGGHPEDREPVAVVLTFNEDQVLVNGVYVDLGEDLMPLVGMFDEINEKHGDLVGVTTRSEPFVN